MASLHTNVIQGKKKIIHYIVKEEKKGNSLHNLKKSK